MQIAKCFRDEDLRADRQPEFTQIDLEMSFVDQDDVIAMQEGFLARVFKELMGVEVKTPFPRIPFDEAMERYGSDKPDTRFGFELKALNDVVAVSYTHLPAVIGPAKHGNGKKYKDGYCIRYLS